MNEQAAKWYLDHSSLKSNELILALALAYRSNEEGICVDSIAQLARLARRSSRQIQSLIAQMSAKNEIEVKRNLGNITATGSTNRYLLSAYRRSAGIESDSLQPTIQPKSNPVHKHIKPTKVYVMQDTANGYYKIGVSDNPSYRERTLQSEKPTIELLFFFDGTIDLERVLHAQYADRRIRGEWFALTDLDVNNIKELHHG